MDIKKLIDTAEQNNTQKVERTKRKVKILRYEEMGFEDCYVTVQKPTITEIGLIQQHQGDELYALTLTVVQPDLNDKELQKAYKVNNAKALIKKLFTDEEQTELSTIAAGLTHVRNKIEVVDEVKN